jgi:hypothetical protein
MTLDNPETIKAKPVIGALPVLLVALAGLTEVPYSKYLEPFLGAKNRSIPGFRGSFLA